MNSEIADIGNSDVNDWHPESLWPLKVIYTVPPFEDEPLNPGCNERFLRCLTTVEGLRLRHVDLRHTGNIPTFTNIGGKVEGLELERCVMDIKHLVNYLEHFTSLRRLWISLPSLSTEVTPSGRGRHDLPKLRGLLRLDFRTKRVRVGTEIDPLLRGLSYFPLRFSKVILGNGGYRTENLGTFLASIPTLETLVLHSSWKWVDLRALKKLHELELKEFRIGSIPMLQTVNRRFTAILLTFRSEDLEPSAIGEGQDYHWMALDHELTALHNHIGNRPLKFYVASTQGDFKFTENLARTFLPRFIRNRRVELDQRLGIHWPDVER